MRDRRLSSLDRYLPVAYLGIVAILIAAILPTALRPPPQQPPSSAELSPDAPPEDNEILITELNKGQSATAGAQSNELIPGEGPGGVAPVPGKPRRGRCFGNPPRQTESLYSPPCAAAFTGDNGGATYKGVTANEIRVVVAPGPLSAGQRASYQGPIKRTPESGETAQDRTYRVMQAYFNQRYELYGRFLQLYHANIGNGEANHRAAAQRSDEEYRVFAAVSPAQFFADEMIRRKLIDFGVYQGPASFYAKNQPYAYALPMDADQLVKLTAELTCKQLANRNASFTGADPLIQGQPRKFGVIAYDDETRVGIGDTFAAELKRGCGVVPAERVNFNLQAQGGQAQAANLGPAIVRMRNAGVTTIVCFCDFASVIYFTQNATNQSYYPEWVMPGTGEMDQNALARLYDKQQWIHSVGISALEMPRPEEVLDYYRAYKEIDPDNTPHTGIGRYLYEQMLQLIGGIQHAGPILNPQTFQQGLLKWPHRKPEPTWAVAGGYRPGDWTYADYVSLVWWDNLGRDPEAPNQPGAYRYVWGGKRFTHGQIPTEPVPFFKDGITQPPEDELLPAQ